MSQPFDADEDVRSSHFDKVTIRIASEDVVLNQWSRGVRAEQDIRRLTGLARKNIQTGHDKGQDGKYTRSTHKATRRSNGISDLIKYSYIEIPIGPNCFKF